MANKSRNAARLHRHARVRKKVFGTPERPRLNVFRSISEIYAQVIDDHSGTTLVSGSPKTLRMRSVAVLPAKQSSLASWHAAWAHITKFVS